MWRFFRFFFFFFLRHVFINGCALLLCSRVNNSWVLHEPLWRLGGKVHADALSIGRCSPVGKPVVVGGPVVVLPLIPDCPTYTPPPSLSLPSTATPTPTSVLLSVCGVVSGVCPAFLLVGAVSDVGHPVLVSAVRFWRWSPTCWSELSLTSVIPCWSVLSGSGVGHPLFGQCCLWC